MPVEATSTGAQVRVWSVLVGRERLGTRELTGGTLIVLGIVAAELGGVLWARRRVVAS